MCHKTYVFYFFIIFGVINSQNFSYNSDDWYILTRPGSINAISEDSFNIYFGTENGIFKYDKFTEDFKYDYTFSIEFNFSEIKHLCVWFKFC